MKPVLLEYVENDTTKGPYLLIGDRRQTVQRIVERGLAELYDEDVEPHDNERFRLPDQDLSLDIQRSELVDKERVDELKRNHYTVYVNENVTENACQVSYSYHP